jgi:hypothetical protein
MISSAADAGAQFAGHVILRFPFQVKTLFVDWLTEHFPQKKESVLNRLKTIRSGSLNSSQFKSIQVNSDQE